MPGRHDSGAARVRPAGGGTGAAGHLARGQAPEPGASHLRFRCGGAGGARQRPARGKAVLRRLGRGFAGLQHRLRPPRPARRTGGRRAGRCPERRSARSAGRLAGHAGAQRGAAPGGPGPAGGGRADAPERHAGRHQRVRPGRLRPPEAGSPRGRTGRVGTLRHLPRRGRGALRPGHAGAAARPAPGAGLGALQRHAGRGRGDDL